QGTIFGRVHPTKSRTSRPATGQVAHSPDTASVPPAPARADAEAPISGGKVASRIENVLERTTRRSPHAREHASIAPFGRRALAPARPQGRHAHRRRIG